MKFAGVVVSKPPFSALHSSHAPLRLEFPLTGSIIYTLNLRFIPVSTLADSRRQVAIPVPFNRRHDEPRFESYTL